MNLENLLAERDHKTIYRDGDKLIKIFDEAFSKADILNEALNLARVEESDLPVPKLREVTKVDGKWAIITDFIPGKSMSHIIRDNPEKEAEYLKRFVELQIQIHNHNAPFLKKLKDKMGSKIDQTDYNATIRYELQTRLSSKPNSGNLCHGDFCPSNIIVTPDDELYVIDWAHATQGTAAADVARSYLVFRLQGESERAKKYLNLFTETADLAKQYVQEWLPIIAASQSVKRIATEKALLDSWVNVVEYE
ncbi:MAG: phosphotransferase [Oscillospiraceae bacterium]|jgi:tRNA A-37 threonylcarbamoyl transferase component Bud32|nr:phosphotransferase [Oscillospiraceae bacterium]